MNTRFRTNDQGTNLVERLQSHATEGQATLLPPDLSPRHAETYRRIRFEITRTGYALFVDFLPGSALRWGAWDRFCPDDAATTILQGSIEDVCKMMRTAIDRAYADNPVYTGDIRYRYS